mmetsp:Transcript_927/g.3346  ORF Transcript_927/g.3346 Transcript_927/m.3346 type:complete len:300 (+) Transcript_927:81-980(+)
MRRPARADGCIASADRRARPAAPSLSAARSRTRRVPLRCAAQRRRDPSTASRDGEESRLQLYTHTLCPYAQRVELLLVEREVPFELHHVDLSDKPRWYLQINPKGLVPTVVLPDGEVITESADICQRLEQMYAPAVEEGTAAKVHAAFMGRCNSDVSKSLAVVAGNSRFWGVGTELSSRELERWRCNLQEMAQLAREAGGPFLTGSEPRLVDFLYFPFMHRTNVVLEELFGNPMMRDANSGDVAPIAQWLQAMERRDCARVSSPPLEQFADALRLHRSLDFFDYVSVSREDLLHQRRAP